MIKYMWKFEEENKEDKEKRKEELIWIALKAYIHN